MEQANVVVTAAFDKQSFLIELQSIIDVSPRVKVTDASELLAQEQRGDLSTKREFDAVLNDAHQHL